MPRNETALKSLEITHLFVTVSWVRIFKDFGWSCHHPTCESQKVPLTFNGILDWNSKNVTLLGSTQGDATANPNVAPGTIWGGNRVLDKVGRCQGTAGFSDR